jgi:hypothetical protein
VAALVTPAGVLALQRAFPAQGRMTEVAGAGLNVPDIGPRDAAGLPVVMIHRKSSPSWRARRGQVRALISPTPFG